MTALELQKRQFNPLAVQNFCNLWLNIPGATRRDRCLNDFRFFCFGVNFNTLAPSSIDGPDPSSEAVRQTACFQRLATFQPSQLPGSCVVSCQPGGGAIMCSNQELVFLPPPTCLQMEQAIATRGRYWFLTDGQLAGIIIGCLIFFGLLLGCCCFAALRWRRNRQQTETTNKTTVVMGQPPQYAAAAAAGAAPVVSGPAERRPSDVSGSQNYSSTIMLDDEKKSRPGMPSPPMGAVPSPNIGGLPKPSQSPLMADFEKRSSRTSKRYSGIDMTESSVRNKNIGVGSLERKPSQVSKARSSFRTMNAGYLPVDAGDEFGVIEDMGDGWVMVRNEKTLKTGLIPRSCLNLK